MSAAMKLISLFHTIHVWHSWSGMWAADQEWVHIISWHSQGVKAKIALFTSWDVLGMAVSHRAETVYSARGSFNVSLDLGNSDQHDVKQYCSLTLICPWHFICAYCQITRCHNKWPKTTV